MKEVSGREERGPRLVLSRRGREEERKTVVVLYCTALWRGPSCWVVREKERKGWWSDRDGGRVRGLVLGVVV